MNVLTTQSPASAIRGIANLIARPSFEVELEQCIKIVVRVIITFDRRGLKGIDLQRA